MKRITLIGITLLLAACKNNEITERIVIKKEFKPAPGLFLTEQWLQLLTPQTIRMGILLNNRKIQNISTVNNGPIESN